MKAKAIGRRMEIGVLLKQVERTDAEQHGVPASRRGVELREENLGHS